MAWHGVAQHVLACADRRLLTTTWFDMATGSRSTSAQAQARASYLEYGTGGAQGRAGQGRACGSWWCRAGWRSAVTATAVQAGNVTARAAAAGMAECAHFVELLRFCILTTDMEFADGGSRATGASAFTMVVVVSGGSVLVFVRPKCSELIRAEALAPWHFALSALSRRWAQPSPQTNNQLATALV